MIYSDNTYDITTNIATYIRRDFKSVFDTTSNKWYMLNNLNNYEEYGIYGDSFDTYYTGKLVIVNGHEYEWNGTEWVDLGEVTGDQRNVKFSEYFPDQASFTTKTINNVHWDMSRPAATATDGVEDVYFSYDGPGSTSSLAPRFSMYYSEGVYTDTGFTDMKILQLSKDSDGYYYYNFSGEMYLSNSGQAYSKYLNYTTWNYAYTFIDTIVYPKYYIEKPAPTISTLYASTIYRNSAHLTTLMRNDAEMVKIDYMSDDILKKGEAPLPYKTNAYIKFPDSTNYSSSPRFETDVYLKNTYTIEFKIKTPDSNGIYNRMMIGTFESYNQLNSNHFAIYTKRNDTASYNVAWWNYGNSSADATTFALQPNTEYIFKIQVGTGETYINGALQSTYGGNNVNGTLSAPLIIGELQFNNPGYNGQIYYVKVTEGDNLIAYYEANNDADIIGYLDKVSGTKITNIGGGTVTYGED